MNVVGLFNRIEHAEEAIKKLRRAGFACDDISLVARASESGESSHDSPGSQLAGGTLAGSMAGLLPGIALLAIPGTGSVLGGGPLAASLAATGIGAAAGGILGALTKLELPEADAKYYADQVQRGVGLLVVCADESADGLRARQIMDEAGAVGNTREPAGIEAGSRPEVQQVTLSGARLYDIDGLEFDPVKSRFEDFGKNSKG